MRWSDLITLINTSYSKNAIGDLVENSSDRQVFANKKSIRQTEFYQAQATGLKPELMFEVRTVEYQGESKLKYNNKEYNIIRTHDKNGEITELICEGLSTNG